MLSFKTSPATHQKISRVSRWLCFAAFVVGLGFLGYTSVAGYRTATAILKDHSVATAAVSLKDVTEEHHRKGRTSLTYNFTYAFEAKGTQQVGEFSTSEDNAQPYLEEGAKVEVAFSNQDPSHFDRLERLQTQADLGGSLKRWLIMLPVGALLALVLHILIVARLFVPREAQAA
ncbi:hypothetical protein A9179_10755 [Pseudomonas alcaligenes]|uniref:DUF3592 domain-containing protein n=1 Tax=Aquipseudomonas alcaligenes TaxID=43263 RepID=A0ABR7S2G7_AQUAC|nr:DUF3592 domain-containing protein [Pseudomonas alcaligenes]MBC9250756.1 hypothetical protein [Pseudomonas alcaligenes]